MGISRKVRREAVTWPICSDMPRSAPGRQSN